MPLRNALRFFVSLCSWDALAQLGEHALLASRSARPDDEVDASSSTTCMIRGERSINTTSLMGRVPLRGSSGAPGCGVFPAGLRG